MIADLPFGMLGLDPSIGGNARDHRIDAVHADSDPRVEPEDDGTGVPRRDSLTALTTPP